jgi:nitrogen regulatory protein PII
MKLLILVLEKVEKMEEVLVSLREAGISGATILNSTGMAKDLSCIR